MAQPDPVAVANRISTAVCLSPDENDGRPIVAEIGGTAARRRTADHLYELSNPDARNRHFWWATAETIRTTPPEECSTTRSTHRAPASLVSAVVRDF